MSRYPNLEAYALFYEKIENGSPKSTKSPSAPHQPAAHIPTLPKEQLAQLSQDLSHPITDTPRTNPHTSQQ